MPKRKKVAIPKIKTASDEHKNVWQTTSIVSGSFLIALAYVVDQNSFLLYQSIGWVGQFLGAFSLFIGVIFVVNGIFNKE